VTTLTAAALALTVVLLFFPEQRWLSKVVTVSGEEAAAFDLDAAYALAKGDSEKILRVELRGSFLPASAAHMAEERLTVKARKDGVNGSWPKVVQEWDVGLLPEALSAVLYSEQASQQHVFDLEEGVDLEREEVSLVIESDSKRPVAVVVRLQFVSSLIDEGAIVGAAILIIMYIMIALEVAHRTVVTMLCATATVAVLAVLDERPTLEEIMAWIDVETLALLFGEETT